MQAAFISTGDHGLRQTRTPSFVNSLWAAAEIRDGKQAKYVRPLLPALRSGLRWSAFITVTVQLLDRVVQFSGEFTPVAPPPTIAMFTLPFAPRLRSISGTDSASPGGSDAPGAVIEENAVLFDTWCIEIVRGAPSAITRVS